MSNENNIEIINNDYKLEIENTENVISVDNTINIDYQYAENKPKINGVTLTGNKSASDLSLLTSTDITCKENTSNKVTTLTSSNTDTQYPSAKCVYDSLALKSNNDLNNLSDTGEAHFDSKYVDVSGDTMTGALTVSNSAPSITCKNTGHVNTETFSEQALLGGVYCTGSDGNAFNTIETCATSANVVQTTIQTKRNISDTLYSAALTLSIDANGNGYFEFPKCMTSPTATSSASASKVAVIVENYINGTSWYRVWSDGWCEQGAILSASADTNCTITLLKPYKDTNYFITINRAGNALLDNDFSVGWKWLGTWQKTSSSFAMRASLTGNGTEGWLARGYIS